MIILLIDFLFGMKIFICFFVFCLNSPAVLSDRKMENLWKDYEKRKDVNELLVNLLQVCRNIIFMTHTGGENN